MSTWDSMAICSFFDRNMELKWQCRNSGAFLTSGWFNRTLQILFYRKKKKVYISYNQNSTGTEYRDGGKISNQISIYKFYECYFQNFHCAFFEFSNSFLIMKLFLICFLKLDLFLSTHKSYSSKVKLSPIKKNLTIHHVFNKHTCILLTLQQWAPKVRSR